MTAHHGDERDARCPTTEELVAFARGELAAEAGETIARHIESCAACLATLNHLNDQADPFLAELRRPVPPDLFSQDSSPQVSPLGTAGAGPAPTGADESLPSSSCSAGTGADAAPVPAGADEPLSPPVVPGYEVLEELGRGGMGVVYRVFDPDLQRRLAIKVLHAKFRGRPDLARRFLAEAQLMAQLQHPGLAPVHDLGRLPDGRPFFAMKLVQGRTLAALLDERRTAAAVADLPQFLAIFEQVCQTLAYAHSRGVIHRDLKPSNVMVGAFGEVQVMDWGVAKVLRRRGDGASSTADPEPDPLATVLTQTGGLSSQAGRVLGTATYMAPEQARGEVEALDERCDVFGLGGMLCVILTGQPPYPGSSLAAEAREAELADTHARLDGCGADAELVALAKACLAGPCAERPRDAGAVASEVAAYQTAVAERARQAELERVATVARAGEARKRRRLWRALAALVALVLLGGAAGGLWYAQREGARAEQESALRQQAETNERAALRDKHITQAVQNFLQHDLLRQADAHEQANALRRAGGGFEAKANPTIRELLDRAAVELAPAKIEAKFPNEPEVQASILKTVGDTYLATGAFDKAVAFLTRSSEIYRGALGADHPMTLSALDSLGVAYRHAGQTTQAIALLKQVRDGFVKKLGAEHPDTLTTMYNLAMTYEDAGRIGETVGLLEQVRDARVSLLGANHVDTLKGLNSLGVAYQRAGKTAEAIALLEQVRDASVKHLGAEHPDTLSTLNNLALSYNRAGRMADAIALLEQVSDIKVKILEADHPDTLTSRFNLALAYRDSGRMAKAIALLEAIRDASVKKLGADHPDTLSTLDGLAGTYYHAGKTAEAISLFEQVRDACMKKLGPDHPETVGTLQNLGLAYRDAGRAAEAVALLEQVRDARLKKLGPDHPETLTTLHNLAVVYTAAGKTAEAIALFEQIRDAEARTFGADHPTTLTTLGTLGTAYQHAGRMAEAIALLEQVQDAYVKKLGVEHPRALTSMNNLGLAYLIAGRTSEAITLFERVRDTHDQMMKKYGAGYPHALNVLNNLGEAYRAAGKLEQALPLFQQTATGVEKQQFVHEYAGLFVSNLIDCHERLKQYEPAEAWRRKWLAVVKERAGPQSAAYAGELAGLGLNLLQQHKHAEAEPLLRDCLSLRTKQQPDAWTTFNAKSLLGDALLGQKKYAEAEPLLLEGYEGMKQREAKIPPQGKVRLGEALDRLVQLYDAWGKPDQADHWRQRRGAAAGEAPRKQ
jgi:serine/threonine protein kinase